MIYTVQMRIEISDEYAPYQREEVADMMEIFNNILDWDIIDEQESDE